MIQIVPTKSLVVPETRTTQVLDGKAKHAKIEKFFSYGVQRYRYVTLSLSALTTEMSLLLDATGEQIGVGGHFFGIDVALYKLNILVFFWLVPTGPCLTIF